MSGFICRCITLCLALAVVLGMAAYADGTPTETDEHFDGAASLADAQGAAVLAALSRK